MISDADLSFNTSTASLSGVAADTSAGPARQANADGEGSSEDEERNELLAILREASSDDDEEGSEVILEDDDEDEEMDQSGEPKGEGEEEIDVEGGGANDGPKSGKLIALLLHFNTIRASVSNRSVT